jgi:hypothetical protein
MILLCISYVTAEFFEETLSIEESSDDFDPTKWNILRNYNLTNRENGTSLDNVEEEEWLLDK